MKLTNAQLKELRETGKVEFPMGTIKRIVQKVNGYHHVGQNKWIKQKGTVVKHSMSLNEDFLVYLRVVDSE